MATYSTECLIDWPWSGPHQVPAVVTYDDEKGLEDCLTLESDDMSGDLLSLPYGDAAGAEHAYRSGWVIHIPTPGETQREMDTDLRVALREHHWVVK